MEFDLIGWGATIFGFIISLIAYIKGVVAKLKLNKAQKVLDNVYNWCIQAENLFKTIQHSGSLKLQTVLDNALRYCVATKTKYDEEKIKKEVEKVITCTKFINARNENVGQLGEDKAIPVTFCENEFRETTDNTNCEVDTVDTEISEKLAQKPVINGDFFAQIVNTVEPTTDVVNKIFLGGGKQ